MAQMTGEKLRYILLHTLGAATFIFVLNQFVLGTSLESSVSWAIGFAAMAGGLAWHHTQR
jgi:hypothetical protein